MGDLSIFDIAGPIMIGPSSSHTAGACKIGQFARAFFHGTPSKITFYLSGSFGQVYKGHATDRALLAGVMKFHTSDPRIKKSFELADAKGIKYKFIPKELGAKYHPNTVEVMMENRNRKMSVIGSSVGGGMIEIVKIDEFEICIHGRAGKYISLVVGREKGFEVLPEIRKRLAKLEIRVVDFESACTKKECLDVISIEGPKLHLKDVQKMEEIQGVYYVRALSKLQK